MTDKNTNFIIYLKLSVRLQRIIFLPPTVVYIYLFTYFLQFVLT